MGGDVVDLCTSDSSGDSEDDLPPLASLTARLQQRGAVVPGAAPSALAEPSGRPAGSSQQPPAAAAAARPPLPAVHNHAGSLFGKQGSSGSEPAPESPRQQYHNQQQREQGQRADAGGPSSQPRRGKRAARPRLAPLFGSDGDGDEEWQPGPGGGGGSQETLPLSPGPAAGRGGSQPRGSQPPSAKKPKRPKRTKEEIERDKALQARQREDKKAQKQAGTQKWTLQQVRLLVDTALVSSGALGVGMLTKLEEHNVGAAAEKKVNYLVAPLDLAPYKALRWQRRHLVGPGFLDGLASLPSSQAAAGAFASLPSSQAAGAAFASLPASQVAGGMGTQASGSSLEERWEEEPHVMVCFQPQEFIDAVLHDRLASLFSLLERRAGGQRPHLLVWGLQTHVMKTERKQMQAVMQPGSQVAVQRSVAATIEDFVAGLAVECPRLCFRDVVDAAQAAQHVRLLTTAIATVPHKDTDATLFLRAHDKTTSQSLTNLFINHPLNDRGLEQVARCLAVVPSVKPGGAHQLATHYGSLGGLMDMLLDPDRDDKSKEAEIADLRNVGGQQRRVGPAAARQLLQLLRSSDPDLRVKDDKEKE